MRRHGRVLYGGEMPSWVNPVAWLLVAVGGGAALLVIVTEVLR